MHACMHVMCSAYVCSHVVINMCVYHSLLQHTSSDVEKVLVGNKCDLESKRVIPYERGEQVSSLSCDLMVTMAQHR